MTETGHDELPKPRIFIKVIMVRDFSAFVINDDDTEAEKAEKTVGLKGAEAFMDLYTEKMIPAVAGPKIFHNRIRHFEPMTTAKLVGEQLRIPASTEAMTILAYMNNYKKWEAMHRWRKEHPGMKCPSWSNKNPTFHLNFKEKYSSDVVPKEIQDWGGWNDDGKRMFVRLQKEIAESRKNNFDRHVKYDQECVDRLYEKYKEQYRYDNPRPKKARSEPRVSPENDPELEWLVEI
jgi:hypothetical protein